MTTPSLGGELATVARLLTSADGRTTPHAAVPWAPSGAGAIALARHSARRARLAATAHLTATRARRRLVVVRPMRGSLRPGPRDRVRRVAGSGYVAYLPQRPRKIAPLVLDVVLGDIGGSIDGRLSVGADGAVRAIVRRPGGTGGLVRMGLSGTAADPSHARAGLEMVASAAGGLAPPVQASGQCAEITWVLEGLLPGSTPAHLVPGLADQVAAFLGDMPAAGRPAEVLDDARVLAEVVPGAAAVVLAAAQSVCESAPAAQGQLVHGDLWAGNLLTVGSRLTGVVDWDAWTPAGVPGVDLLHLLATDARIRQRRALGEIWLQRPWENADFVGPVRRYWPAWGGDADARAAVGVAWWLSQLARDLRRNPTLGRQDAWVQRNITTVTEVLGRDDWARRASGR